MANFAVVGAGLAGTSVAHRLKNAGHHCVVFEKSQSRGGRLSTQHLSDWQVDHGTQYFTARSPQFEAEVQRWQQEGWVARWPVTPWMLGRESLEPSPDEQIRYVGVPTMNAMVQGLCDGIELYNDTRIDRLENQGDQWRLWDQQGEHYGLFDAIILTAPLAQTLALLPEGSRAEASMRTANMTPTWAFAIALSEPSGIEADALFSNNGIVTWAAKDSSKPGRDSKFETWIIHFSPKWSSNHLEAPGDLLQHQAVQLLERLAGSEIHIHDVFQHRWLHARSASMEVSITQWDSLSRIGLAGDWTMGSRLEDAWLSAQALAEQLENEFADTSRR